MLIATGYAESLMLHVTWWHWVLLGAWFIGLILADLFIFHKKDHIPTLKEAVNQSLLWIGLGIALGLVVLVGFGQEAGVQYFSGYLIEKSLSIDNVFAWAVIMGYFKVPKQYQHRVLFWGIFGALVMRTIFVFLGIAMIERFESVLLLFGLVLLWSGGRLLFTHEDHEFDPSKSLIFKAAKRIIPVSHHLDGHKLFTRENGKLMATGLFMALLVVEITDAVFAVDSVPAILAVSREPFIILSSNAAAILGLRALYFVFDKIKDMFWLLNKGLGLLLISVGIKMAIAPQNLFGMRWFGIHVPTVVSLGIIAVLLTGAIVLSLLIKPKKTAFDRIEG